MRSRHSSASPFCVGGFSTRTNPWCALTTESTSTSATIEVEDIGVAFGYSRFGSGVNKITIQTHSSGGTGVRVATVEPIPPGGELPGLAPGEEMYTYEELEEMLEG